MHNQAPPLITALAGALLLLSGSTAHADHQQCGQPLSTGARPTTSDALFTLRAAVGAASCALWACDADGSGAVTTTDALRVLKTAVGQPTELACPLPEAQCGDGHLAGAEVCDDGNLAAGDGCSPRCT